MQVKISKIELPQQKGCQHIHFTLEYPDKKTEVVTYHMSDFTSPEITQANDPVYLQIKTLFKIEDAKAKSKDSTKQLTRDDVEVALKDLTIEK